MNKKTPAPPESIGVLVGRLFLALPPLYAVWFFGAELLFAPLVPLLEMLLAVLMHGTVESLELLGHMLEFETLLPIKASNGQWSYATISVDVLMYTFNLPTLIALLWATRALSRPITTLLLAYALLLPTWLWSLGFWFTKSAIFGISEQAARSIGITGIGLELIGLGYQFGTLILPSLSVVLSWAWICPEQMNRLFGEKIKSADITTKTKRVPKRKKPKRK